MSQFEECLADAYKLKYGPFNPELDNLADNTVESIVAKVVIEIDLVMEKQDHFDSADIKDHIKWLKEAKAFLVKWEKEEPKPFLIRKTVSYEYVYASEEQRKVHVEQMESRGWEASSQRKSNMLEYGQKDLGLRWIGKFSKEEFAEHPDLEEAKAIRKVEKKLMAISLSARATTEVSSWGEAIRRQDDKFHFLSGFSLKEANSLYQAIVILKASRLNLQQFVTGSGVTPDQAITSAQEIIKGFINEGKLIEHSPGEFHPYQDEEKNFRVALTLSK